MKYDIKTRTLCKWLYKYIDRYNWGYYHARLGEVQRSNSEDFIAKGHHWQQITMTPIEGHLESAFEDSPTDTVYYTSSSKAEAALLCVDIDAHNQEPNAEDVAAWIKNNYFPQAYYEPSTRGWGRHLYILVSVSAVSPHGNKYYFSKDKFNAFIQDFAEKLAYVVDDEFLADKQETANVCGVYGTLTYNDRETKERCWGKLAKMPRPRTMTAVEQLVNMPIYDMYDLAQVVVEAKEREPKKIVSGMTIDWGEELPKIKPTKSRAKRSSQEELFDRLYHWNPSVRVFNAVCELTRQLDREPTIDEAHQFYCEMGLNTGDDESGRRFKRIEAAIDKVWADYDSEKNSKPYDISTYQKGEYLEILTDKLTEDDLRSTKYARKITFDDLDLLLAVIWTGITEFNIGDEDRFCSVGVEYVKGAFASAREEKMLKSTANDQKVSAMRGLCMQAGIIDVDTTWVKGGKLFKEGWAEIVPCQSKNRGMRYYPTELHPKYDAYKAINQRHKKALAQGD